MGVAYECRTTVSDIRSLGENRLRGYVRLRRGQKELIGFVTGRRGVGRRQAHSIYIAMGVLQAWVGRGIGRSLLEALEGWAQSNGLHRLELMVNYNNERAIRLYEKFGFEREGVKRHALRVDGRYIDAFYMAKLIGG